MKRIEAFIQPHRLTKVVRALHDLPNFPGFTVYDARGQGHGRGAGGQYAYGDDTVSYHARQVLVVICTTEEADAVARTIARAAHTHNKGDGIVAISEVSSILRIGDAHAQAGDTP